MDLSVDRFPCFFSCFSSSFFNNIFLFIFVILTGGPPACDQQSERPQGELWHGKDCFTFYVQEGAVRIGDQIWWFVYSDQSIDTQIGGMENLFLLDIGHLGSPILDLQSVILSPLSFRREVLPNFKLGGGGRAGVFFSRFCNFWKKK